MSDKNESCLNTDETLFQEKHNDHWGSFNDSLFKTKEGLIGINVAGTVYVQSLKKWHALEQKLRVAREALKKIVTIRNEAHPDGAAGKATDMWRKAALTLEETK